MEAIKKLKELGFSIVESDDPNRKRIDFNITDSDDNVAWVWGDKPNDVDWECNHPIVEYDGKEQGQCALCGCFCDWHYQDDGEGHEERVPHEWYPRRNPGGIIEEYLKGNS